jgi:hypothetical protein
MQTTDNALVTLPMPRVVIGQDNAGSRRSIGAEIAAVIDWAIARGAPLLKGTVDALVTMPYSEHSNVRCSDVIQQCLRLQPDVVAWFDYSTLVDGVPVPTFNCRAASNLTAVDVALHATDVDSISLTPRYDIQVPGLSLYYSATHQYDGKSWETTTVDSAGTTSDARAIRLLFDLDGSSRTTQEQALETGTYPDMEDEEDAMAWWKAQVPWLAEIADADLVISDIVRSGEEDYPRYLVNGQVASWMGVAIEEETWTCNVAYIRKTGADVDMQVDQRVVQITLKSTNGATKTYSRTTSFVAAEPVPAGVAAALYASWNRLHWDGDLRLVEAETSFQAVPANLVNLTGSRTEWTTMAALVQEAVIDLAAGTSALRIGTCGRVEADSLVALFRAAHFHRFSFRALMRVDAEVAGDKVEGPSAAAMKLGSDGDNGRTKRLVIRDSVTENGTAWPHVIDLAPSLIDHATDSDAAARTLQPREVWIVYDDSGTKKAKKCQVLASALYGTAATLGASIPSGNAAGQILIWDTGTGAWIVSTVGALSSGDFLKWDGSKFVKVTPSNATFLSAWRVDKTNHKFQVKTIAADVFAPGAESAWTDVSDSDGGVLDEGFAI